MKTIKYTTKSKYYVGRTVDNCHREVHVFSDGECLHAVYNLGKDDEFVSTEYIKEVEKDPDAFLYTIFVEFVNPP